MKLGRLRKWALRPAIAAAAIVATAVGWNFATGNFGPVIEGRAYRSAQLSPSGLARAIREHGVRTVLNLRGRNRDRAWYRGEREATLAAGATQVDIALSSCVWMSRTQLRTLVDVLETCEKPVLIHCWRGAERTGLASAFLALLQDGSTLADARAQFSLRHLFVRYGDGKVTAEHLDQYASWLATNRLDHSPAAFRRWVATGYRPGKPNREDWPIDPYPLVVTTRPTPHGPEEIEVFDPRGRPIAGAARAGLEPAAVR